MLLINLRSLGYNPKIVEVNVSKGRVIDCGIMMIARNPIAIVYAKKDNIIFNKLF